MKRKTAIAISGGVDSLAAAYLLKKDGMDVTGLHFITGYETQPHEDPSLSKIFQIADQLDIDIKIIDCRVEFKSKIIDYFTQTYRKGKTPNPCMVCNALIKFGTVLDYAEKLGAFCFATGHYARVEKDTCGRFHLYKGVDQTKDQSYFLAFLTQKQLAMACFPLGGMTKSDVVKLSKKKGFNPLKKTESQDICFIKGKNYSNFLTLQPEYKPEPGHVEDTSGNIIGNHNGLYLFTIGQRRGINCPGREPYYVVRLDMEQNRLIVGFKKDLMSHECRVEQINWINQAPDSPIKIHTRIRYRHNAVPATLFPVGKHSAIIRFQTPQTAVTPGQGAVFYKDDEVLGGGWIQFEK